MPLAWKSAPLPKPHTELHTGHGTLRFYHADCLEVLRVLDASVVSAIVTSPPYNLGVRWRWTSGRSSLNPYQTGRPPRATRAARGW